MAETINVGGIQYTLDPSKSGINYLFRSYHEFKNTFQHVAERSGIPLQRIQQLFVTYFRVEPFAKQEFVAINAADKKDLIKIFDAYLKYLENSKANSGDSIISIMLNRTYYQINDILSALKDNPKDVSRLDESCKESREKIMKLTDDMRKQMILEFTWLLEHPKDIRTEAGCKWADMVAALSDIRLTDITSQLKEEPSETEQVGGGMISRVKSLLTVVGVLQTAKKFKKDGDSDDSCAHVEQLLSDSIVPLFDHIHSMYQPVYDVVQNCMKRNHVKKNKLIFPLLKLLHISNHFIGSRKEAYGIYRIRHSGKRLVSYLTSQLQCISATLDKMKPNKRRDYHEVQQQLTPVTVSSLPKRKAVASSKKGVSLPMVQFLTLGGNLTLPPFEQFYRKGSESEKEQFYQVMTDFFTDDNIYMVYSQSEEIPLHFYDISLSSVDTADSYIPVTVHDTKRIVEDHVLQDFASFTPNATYTNAELVLSIFIALKEKKTK